MYLRSNGAYEFYRGAVSDPYDKTSAEILSPGRNPAVLARYRALGEAGFFDDARQRWLTFMRAHPRATARNVLTHAWLYWTGTIEVGWGVNRLRFFLPAVLAVGGLIFLRRSGERLLTTIGVTVLLVFPLPYYLVPALPRFRMPIEPTIWLMTAALLHAMAGLRPKRLQA